MHFCAGRDSVRGGSVYACWRRLWASGLWARRLAVLRGWPPATTFHWPSCGSGLANVCLKPRSSGLAVGLNQALGSGPRRMSKRRDSISP